MHEVQLTRDRFLKIVYIQLHTGHTAKVIISLTGPLYRFVWGKPLRAFLLHMTAVYVSWELFAFHFNQLIHLQFYFLVFFDLHIFFHTNNSLCNYVFVRKFANNFIILLVIKHISIVSINIEYILYIFIPIHV